MKESLTNLWTILAQSSSIDRDNNTLSLFDILEEITFQIVGPTPEKTVLPLNLQLVSLWERENSGKPESLRIKFVLRDPANNVLTENEGELRMEPHHKRSRFRAQFQGMPVTGPGRYRYEILSLEPKKTKGEELISTVSFEIKIVNQPVKSPLKL